MNNPLTSIIEAISNMFDSYNNENYILYAVLIASALCLFLIYKWVF